MASAFEQLVQKSYEGLYRFAVCLTGDPEAAADLVQEAFESRIQSGIPETDLDRMVEWLYMTLYRLFLAQTPEEELEIRPPPPRIRPQEEEEAAAEEEEQTLHFVVEHPEKLDLLDDETVLQSFWDVHPAYRAPLALFYLGGFSVHDIARLLDTTVSSVRQRILKGKEMLYRGLSGKISARSRKILLLQDAPDREENETEEEND